MTLAGTRPPTVDEWDKYELHHRARLATKPGLTGMWQVSGRSNITDLSTCKDVLKVLLCDELEAGLHESLVFELVRLFMEWESDNFPQIFFTTHETGLLNMDLFRRDQIWFTEMRLEDRSTELYSLAEIKNIRKDENFGKGYISGKYGGIPMLNVDFANIVSKM